jgi:hypothetical protein
MPMDGGERFYLEQHNQERQVLFGNEAFVIAMLQAVSGAGVFGTLSQFDALLPITSRLSLLFVLTFLIAALICAVLAALFRYRYKMWDIKAIATNLEKERTARAGRFGRCLILTRLYMVLATAFIVMALMVLIVAMWIGYLAPI